MDGYFKTKIMTWTQADIDRYNNRKQQCAAVKIRGKARGSAGRKGMNKTEAHYQDVLNARKKAGEILDFFYESIKFRLADQTWFEIDFMVIMPSMEIEMHEVKARWKTATGSKEHIEDDANVKIKVAAELYPFKFVVASYYKGDFFYREV